MDEELLKKIIKKYGKKAQVLQTIEEMSELTKELMKNINRNKDNEKEIILEIADVQIMLAQLTLIYNLNPEKLQGAIEFKLERMKERITNED